MGDTYIDIANIILYRFFIILYRFDVDDSAVDMRTYIYTRNSRNTIWADFGRSYVNNISQIIQYTRGISYSSTTNKMHFSVCNKRGPGQSEPVESNRNLVPINIYGVK